VEATKRLKDLQRTFDEKMAAQELEMEEMLAQKDDLEAELASTKKDEKELRLKDVSSWHCSASDSAFNLCYDFSSMPRNN
jgi:hypothetical protein